MLSQVHSPRHAWHGFPAILAGGIRLTFVLATRCCSQLRCECKLFATCARYGEAGLKGGLGGMGGQGGEAYGSPFDIFEQFFGGQGELCSYQPVSYHLV